MHTVSKIILGLGFAAIALGASAADVLTGKNGMTLYTFDKDSHNKSACAAQCLAAWPAARSGDAAGKEFGEITRDDGTKQLTHRGKPLYYYAGDKKRGDISGDNVGNVWHVVQTGKKTSATDTGSYGGYSY